MVKRHRTNLGPGRGFALVDVIVGAIIVGVSLSVIIGLTGRALTSQKKGEELATAANLADEALQLVLARGPDDYGKRFDLQGRCDPPFQDYNYRLTFAEGNISTPYRVSVTISWGGAAGAGGSSIIIETLMASRDGGLDDLGGQPDPIRTPEEPIVRTP